MFPHKGCLAASVLHVSQQFLLRNLRTVISDERPDGQVPGGPSGLALLAVAALICLGEGLSLIGLAVLDLTTIESERASAAIGVALMLILLGASVIFTAVRLFARAAWARSPLVLTQLIALLLAWNLRTAAPWLPITVGVCAAIALVCLVVPATTRALTHSPIDPQEQ